MTTSGRTDEVRWPQIRLCSYQYGDFRDSSRRLDAGGDETFFNQREQVDLIRGLAARVGGLAQVCLRAEQPYEERLSYGITVYGNRLWRRRAPDVQPFIEFALRFGATHATVATPSRQLINGLLRAGIRVLPSFADSFNSGGVRGWLRHRRLARTFNHPEIQWVANHNVPAAMSLVAIGVKPEKVIPWDYALRPMTSNAAPKSDRGRDGTFRLFYAGRILKSKGVGDIIEAVAQLTRDGIAAAVTFAGAGELDTFAAYARQCGVDDRCIFLGSLGHEQVMRDMAEHDAVVVASRPSYPEGLPMVIYESLMVGTPLLYSDHPVLRDRLRDRRHGLMFRAGAGNDLAAKIRLLAADADLRQRLREERQQRLDELRCPVTPMDVLERWLTNSEEDRAWLRSYSIASGRYEVETDTD